MEDLQKRVDSLIGEIRDLNKQKDERIEEIRKLKARIMEQTEQAKQQRADVEELTKKVLKLKKQVESKEKKIRNNEKAIKSESRRKELFNNKVLGSSRTQGEYYMSLEMKALNERYEIMKRFIVALSEEFCFDSEIFDELLKIADGFDDPVIITFLNNIAPKKENIKNPDNDQAEK